MKKILFPTDYSDGALNALNYTIEIASYFNARVTVFNSCHMPQAGSTTFMNYNDLVREDSERNMKQFIAQSNFTQQIELDTKVWIGTTVDDIINEQQNGEYDYIMLGSKGVSGLKEVLIGSTASKVLNYATCPVMVIPPGITFNPFKEILFAADLKKHSKEKFDQLKLLVDTFDAKLDIIHAINESFEIDVPNTLYKSVELNKLKENFKAEILEVDIEETQDFETLILTKAKEKHTDLIVTIKEDKNFFYRLFFESLSNTIAMHVKHFPLLVIK